jgi:hypothetical protein
MLSKTEFLTFSLQVILAYKLNSHGNTFILNQVYQAENLQPAKKIL